MRAIMIKDPHLRMSMAKPVGRTDSFEEQILAKVKALCSYAIKEEYDTLLIPGDIFDVKAVSKYSFSALKANEKVLDLLKEAFNEIITIPGNHDLPFATIETLQDSVYWHFVKHNYFKDITGKFIEQDNAILVGLPYYNSKEDVILAMRDANEKVKLFTGKPSIILVHEHFISNEKLGFPGTYFTYKEAAKLLSNFDIVLCGHLHKGIKPYVEKVDGVTFCNPWSFTRLARNYYTLSDEHVPGFITIDTDTMEIKHHYLEAVKTKNVFIVSELEKALQIESNIEDFKQKMSEFAQTSGELKIPKELEAKIKHYLSQVED